MTSLSVPTSSMNSLGVMNGPMGAYHAMLGIAANTPVLLTTADHPLLSAVIVDHFCSGSLACDAADLRPGKSTTCVARYDNGATRFYVRATMDGRIRIVGVEHLL